MKLSGLWSRCCKLLFVVVLLNPNLLEFGKTDTGAHGYFSVTKEEKPYLDLIQSLEEMLQDKLKTNGLVPMKDLEPCKFDAALAELFIDTFKQMTKKEVITQTETDLANHLVQKYKILKVWIQAVDSRDTYTPYASCYNGDDITKYLNSPISKIYIINLVRRKDRRQMLLEKMPSSMKYEFWPATDKRDIRMPEGKSSKIKIVGGHNDHTKSNSFSIAKNWKLDVSDDQMKIVPGILYKSHTAFWHSKVFWGRDLLDGEVACSISHWSLWNEIRKKNLDYAIILEDDLVLSAPALCDFQNAVKKLSEEGVPWDIIYLDTGVFLGDKDNTTGGVSDFGLEWAVLGFTYSSWSYALSNEGAKKLISGKLENCVIPIDDFLPFMYSPEKHPRKDYFLKECMLTPPSSMLALRWRGRGQPKLVTHLKTSSEIESQNEAGHQPHDNSPDELEEGFPASHVCASDNSEPKV